MSLEDLDKAIDEKFKELEAAFELDTGEELQLFDERANSKESLFNEGETSLCNI